MMNNGVMSMKILVVEDEQAIADLMIMNLQDVAINVIMQKMGK